MLTRRRFALAVCAVALLAAVLVLLIMTLRVHARYGEWGLTPSTRPPQIVMDGRVYRRGEIVRHLEANYIAIGHVGSEATIYGPARPSGTASALDVRVDNTVTQYVLAGGA